MSGIILGTSENTKGFFPFYAFQELLRSLTREKIKNNYPNL